MWMRAVCTSEYIDSNGVDQKVELTQWLTSLTKQQMMQILEQKQREQAYAESVGEDTSQNSENQNQENTNNNTNTLGPVPEGYNSWDEVPAEQLFNILQNQLNTQQ
jgi:hypothetical protein